VTERDPFKGLRLPILDGMVAFSVDTEEGDPSEAGPLDVVIDGHGIALRWTGERRARWRGDWTELRKLIESWAIVEGERKEAAEELASARECHADAERELSRAKGDATVTPMPKGR
jgi:hypothetical protein